MARSKAGWGEARTAIAVIIGPYLAEIRGGASVSKIYDALSEQGKTEGFSKDALYHYLRKLKADPKGKGKKSLAQTKGVGAGAALSTPPRPVRAGTVLPASPVVSGDLPPSLFGEVNLEDWAEQMLGGDAEAPEGGE